MMRSILSAITVTAALLISGSVFAQANMDGTSHDLVGSAFGDAQDNGEICVYCHTPHGAQEVGTPAPLWNKDVTAASFTTYTSPTGTMDATVGAPGTASIACLSCHDGTIATNSVLNSPLATAMGTVEIKMIASDAGYVGTDLSNDHPIGMTYSPGDGVGLDAGLVNPAPTSLPLFTGKVECASCHDVHATSTAFLRLSNVNSGLCLDCHTK